MTAMKYSNSLLLLIALLMSACMPLQPGQPTIPTDDNPPNLANSGWLLESFGAPGAEAPVINGSSITLAFEGNGQAGGHSGCNSYGGPYSVQGSTLKFAEISSTLIACDDQTITDQEKDYLNALRTAGRFTVDGEFLTIWYEGDSKVLNFVQAPATASINSPEPMPGRERVVFEPGATSATRSGTLNAGEVKEYVVIAAAGQRMHVQTTGYSAPVHFTLSGPDGHAWSGEPGGSDIYIFTQEVFLPEDGDYVVMLSVPAGEKSTRYDVALTVDIGSQSTEPPERVLFESGVTSVQRSGPFPNGAGVKQYVLAAREGQTMTVTLTSDGAPISLMITTPSGAQRIPETSPADGVHQISHSFSLAESGDYVVILNKADHTSSTNYEVTFLIE